MARRFKMTIIIDTTDDIKSEDLTLRDSDVIDGFEITRDADDITEIFQMTDAYIDNVEEM